MNGENDKDYTSVGYTGGTPPWHISSSSMLSTPVNPDVVRKRLEEWQLLQQSKVEYFCGKQTKLSK